MSRTFVRLLLFFSSALGLAMACGDSDTCVQSKCVSGAWMHVPIPAGVATGLASGSLTVCRNTECYVATLPALPAADSGGVAVYFQGDSPVLATLSQQVDQTVGLDVEWRLADATLAVEGDRYMVTVTPVAGSPTALLDKAAAYHATSPNPGECTPAATCSIAELAP